MPIVGPSRLDEVVAALEAGEVVAIPTDTVYGLAARADLPAAVLAMIALKSREPGQPIAVLFDDITDIEPYARATDAFDRLSQHWPGPLTLVTEARPGAVEGLAVADDGTIGVRQPDDALTRRVLRAAGGVLAVSSANRSGQPAATSADEVAAVFGEHLLILDGGPRRTLAASTVVDVTSESPRILREGPLTAERLGIEPPHA